MSFKDELTALDAPKDVSSRDIVVGLENISTVCIEATLEEAEQIWPILEASLDTKVGFGLAAIQIGIPKKVGIIKYRGEILRLLNTTLEEGIDKGVIYDEGCLSLPGQLVNTERYGIITVNDEFLGKKTYNLAEHGLLPVIIQHEIGHFEGKTIFDYKRKPFRRNCPKIGRNDPCPCASGKKFKKCNCGLFTTSR